MSALAGTGSLVRLALRRDRALLPAVLAALVGTAAFSASATVDLYPDVAARVHAAKTSNATPALVALYGRIYDETSIGALVAHQDEQPRGVDGRRAGRPAGDPAHARVRKRAGRLELVGATAVGRYGPLSAAMVIGAVASVGVGGLTTLGLMAAGLDARGSLAFGLAWTATGLAFAAVGAVAAQLTPSTRAWPSASPPLPSRAPTSCGPSATSAGTNGPSWLSWLSPIGWAQQVRAFAGDRWAVLLLLLAFAGVAGAGAFALAGRRDLGAGVLPDRPGPALGRPAPVQPARPGLAAAAGRAARLHGGIRARWAW